MNGGTEGGGREAGKREMRKLGNAECRMQKFKNVWALEGVVYVGGWGVRMR